jgi:hypothetical protein
MPQFGFFPDVEVNAPVVSEDFASI